MNPMIQMLSQQRVEDLHRQAAHGRLVREAKAARAKSVKTIGWRLRRRQIAVAA